MFGNRKKKELERRREERRREEAYQRQQQEEQAREAEKLKQQERAFEAYPQQLQNVADTCVNGVKDYIKSHGFYYKTLYWHFVVGCIGVYCAEVTRNSQMNRWGKEYSGDYPKTVFYDLGVRNISEGQIHAFRNALLPYFQSKCLMDWYVLSHYDIESYDVYCGYVVSKHRDDDEGEYYITIKTVLADHKILESW